MREECFMQYYINDRRQPEKYFWNCLSGIASQRQVQRLLDGIELIIGGVKYKIEDEK